MAAFFGNLRNTVIAGFVLALIVLVIHGQLNGWAIDAETFTMFPPTLLPTPLTAVPSG